MSLQTDFLVQLTHIAQKKRQRYGVVINGDEENIFSVIHKFIELMGISHVTKLGGSALKVGQCITYKQGHQLLGDERELIVYDAVDGFDANSFTASSGSLVGGGLYLVLNPESGVLSHRWFQQSFNHLLQLSENNIPELPAPDIESEVDNVFEQQNRAIEAIKHVVNGHRKRPLVITADRGRGKSASLGIAASQLMQEKPLKILVTAPARKSVDPIFIHAREGLSDILDTQKNRLSNDVSSLTFISPDELLKLLPECDLLLVDEAAAIPLPLLTAITENYHRIVFSTTVHGYEGCGRGFSIKFSQWLEKNRPGWKSIGLSQPIRWAEDDPLEKWLFDSFLLDAEPDNFELELNSTDGALRSIALKHISKDEIASNRALLRHCFALLISAHYQTSPNDLQHLLVDENTHLITIELDAKIVGCLLVVMEGNIDEPLLAEILLGQRRPKGQLVPTTIATQLGTPEVAKLNCMRIMRIAVKNEYQSQGIGQQALSLLNTVSSPAYDYVATSFGVTQELLTFWRKNGFVPLRLGAKRDQASGTHSLLMVKSDKLPPSILELVHAFPEHLLSLLSEVFKCSEPELMTELLFNSSFSKHGVSDLRILLIQGYCRGSVGYESAYLDIYKLLTQLLIQGVAKPHSVVFSKFFQRIEWADISRNFNLMGRKQVEKLIREELQRYLNLHCKSLTS